MAFMDKYITPYAAKMGAQRHLVAVRDAFVAMIPLTIIGSLATLINNSTIKALNNFLAENTFGQQIKTLNGDIWFGTLAIMALLLVIGVAYNLAKSYEENGLQAAMIATWTTCSRRLGIYRSCIFRNRSIIYSNYNRNIINRSIYKIR